MVKLNQRIKRFISWKNDIFDHQDKVDLGRSEKLPIAVKLKYNLLGFTDQNYCDYNLADNDYHNYISFDERIRLDNVNGRFAYALGEKLTFERNFGSFVNVPHIFWWNRDGVFIDPDKGDIVSPIRILEQEQVLILKPSRSTGGGYGVIRIESKDGKLFFDQRPMSATAMLENLSTMKDYICVKFVSQAEYAKTIFPNTTNSIRIATGFLQNQGYVVLFAFHRFGTKRTKAVDNISSGGVFAYIDENGVMSSGRSLLDTQNPLARHPNTNAQIEGVSIPDWQSTCDSLIKAHKRFPYLKFIAWDVVIGDDLKPYILEINRGSDLHIQIIKPQRNEKLGQFMRENNMLSPRIDK